MSGRNFIVAPRSWLAIEQAALQWRDPFVPLTDPETPIIELMEGVLCNRLGCFMLLAGDRQEMGGAEGYTYPDGSCIQLREDVLRGAYAGSPRDRFTAAHELGHWVLHVNQPLARAIPGQNIAAYRLSEPQANQFASEILMPRRFFSKADSLEAVMLRHRVSAPAAQARLDYLGRKGMI